MTERAFLNQKNRYKLAARLSAALPLMTNVDAVNEVSIVAEALMQGTMPNACWCCERTIELFESGLCFECYTWAENQDENDPDWPWNDADAIKKLWKERIGAWLVEASAK